jgi:hypothetical protein
MVQVVIHHVLDGAETEVPEFGGSPFDIDDLVEGKRVTGAFVPIGHIRAMEAKA